MIHSLQISQGINSLAHSQSRLKPTARHRAFLVHFNGLELLARSLNSGRVSGKRINPALKQKEEFIQSSPFNSDLGDLMCSII